MGIIRGGLFTLVTIAFLIAVLIFGVLMTISDSLDYKNVHENVGTFVLDQINNSLEPNGIGASDINTALAEAQPNLEALCQNDSSRYLSSEDGIFPGGEALPVEINLSCASVEKGSDAIISEVVNESIDQLYTKNYDCQLFDCLDNETQAFYFFSQDFKDYVEGKYTLFLIAIIVIFILMFVIAENKSNSFIVAGFLMVLISLPFMKLNSIFGFLDGYLQFIFNIFFNESYITFIRVFIAGIVLLAFGLVLKFTSLGTRLGEYLDKIKHKNDEEKDKKELKQLREEISETKKQKPKSTSKKKS